MELESLRQYKTGDDVIATVVRKNDLIFAVRGRVRSPEKIINVRKVKHLIVPSYYRNYGKGVETMLECKDGIQIGDENWSTDKKTDTHCEILPLFELDKLYDESVFRIDHASLLLKELGLLWLLKDNYFTYTHGIDPDLVEVFVTPSVPVEGENESSFGGRFTAEGVRQIGEKTFVAESAFIVENAKSNAEEKFSASDIGEIIEQIESYKDERVKPDQIGRMNMVVTRLDSIISSGRLLNDSDIVIMETILNSYR